jgi:hypothetical protein
MRLPFFALVLCLFACVDVPLAPAVEPELGVDESELNRVTGRFAVAVDGNFAGFASSVEGGSVFAEVVNVQVGPGRLATKSISRVKTEPLKLELTGVPTPALVGLLSEFLGGDGKPHQVRVVEGDANNNVVEARVYLAALVTELGMPALDASAKDPARLLLTLQPESVVEEAAGGRMPEAPAARSTDWSTANFQLALGGLPTSRVIRIEPFTFTRAGAGAPLGVPNLKVTFAAQDLPGFKAFFQSFVVAGNNGSDKELSGSLALLSRNLRDAAFTLRFKGVGMVSLRRAPSANAADARLRSETELYVEEAQLTAP